MCIYTAYTERLLGARCTLHGQIKILVFEVYRMYHRLLRQYKPTLLKLNSACAPNMIDCFTGSATCYYFGEKEYI